MSLEQKALLFAQAVGADIGTLIDEIGSLASLSTTNKQNLVAAINELKATLDAVDLTALINDTAGAGVANQAWSADKIISSLQQLKQEILDGAPGSFDTLKEIADYLAANDNSVNDILVDIGNRVRYDAAQTLTSEQQLTACTNIGINDYAVDLASIYATAKGETPEPPPPSGGSSSPEATGGDFAFTGDGSADGSSGEVSGNNFNFVS